MTTRIGIEIYFIPMIFFVFFSSFAIYDKIIKKKITTFS